MGKLWVIFFFTFSSLAQAGWVINCENYCAFSEFQNNCQGIYYQYPDGHQSYSSYSSNYQGCLETRYLTTDLSYLDSHVLPSSQISCNCPATSAVVPNENSDLTTETREKLERLREQIRYWMLCAPPLDMALPQTQTHFNYQSVKSCKEFKGQKKLGHYFHPRGCEPGQAAWGTGCFYPGDTPVETFWLCLSGEGERCDDIRRAHNSTTGAWYRNEFQKTYPQFAGGSPLFSRDQTLGILGFLAATKDKVRAKKWLTFIKNNPKYMGFYSMCPQRPDIAKPASVSQKDWDHLQPDDRCMINSSVWGMIYKTFLFIGVTQAEIEAISPEIYQKMILGNDLTVPALVASAPTTPAKGPDAYMTHLIVNNIQILNYLGVKPKSLDSTLNLANERTSKLNPRFHYLAKGKATEYGAYLIRKYCRGNRPNFGYWANFGNQSAAVYGLPENQADMYVGGNMDYAYPYFKSKAFGERTLESGFECVGWINMYLGNATQMSLQCEPGDLLLDGACRKVAFPKALVPPVAGMGYSTVFPWIPDVTYVKINYSECIGSSGVVESDHCKISGVTPLSNDRPDRSEYIDPLSLNPGLYYPAINNSCSMGGALLNGQCLLLLFPLPNPNLVTNINYKVVQSNLSGVYYDAMGSSCPYGGTLQPDGCLVYDLSSAGLEASKLYFVRKNFRWPGVYYYPQVIAP